MYDKIIIPTDGSEQAKEAVKQALEIAKALKAKVLALYVIDTTAFSAIPKDALTTDIHSILLRNAQEAVNYIVRECKKLGIFVESKIAEGVPSEEIIKSASPNDLIVIGTKGRSGVVRLLLGSVAENVVRHAKCHVLVVRK
ncbi:MAG: universal stress protein [Candidatus Thermoplasmatota archaeon]|nr:universal stress protein [Candidatus Thermoplasmatota archaeon]MDI6856145.1 universal stress protein [Candidatus Thermoplasmatota archaeon]